MNLEIYPLIQKKNCRECGTEDDLIVMHNDTMMCRLCRLKMEKSFLTFCEYWMKYKITSDDGRRILEKIIKETKEIIRESTKERQDGIDVVRYKERPQKPRNNNFFR